MGLFINEMMVLREGKWVSQGMRNNVKVWGKGVFS